MGKWRGVPFPPECTLLRNPIRVVRHRAGLHGMNSLAGRCMLLWGWRRALAAFIAGGAASFALPPYDFFAVCFLSFPVLVWLLDGAAGDGGRTLAGRLWPAFATGWWFGFGYFAGGLWWVGNAMLVDIRAYAWALPIAVLALPAGMAVFYGLAAALARLLWSDGIGRIAALAAAFALLEWLRSFVLTGFPWNAIGYAAMPVPVLMQSVTAVGMMGMNALAVLVFALPAMLAAGPGARRAAVALWIALVALHYGYGHLRLAPVAADGRVLDVRLVQPSIDQSRKWDRALRDEIFRTYLDMSARPPEEGARKPRLILWPETSVPFIFNDRPDALVALGELIDDDQVLMAGAVRREGESANDPDVRYYNSLVAINSSGEQYDATDKVHLVPLGEFVPFESWLARIGITKLVELPGGFSAGSARKPMRVAEGVSAVGYICYEVIFPGLPRAEAADADLILNVTNDGWFGDSPGPYQHFRQAQVRAVEAGRPLVRAANNGVSGVVDSYGRVVDALELDGVGVLDAAVPLDRATPIVPERPGLAGWIVAGLLAALALAARLRRQPL